MSDRLARCQGITPMCAALVRLDFEAGLWKLRRVERLARHGARSHA
jgi:hypothetical protein